MTIAVEALLFARFAELTGTDRLSLTLPAGAVAGDVLATVRARPGGSDLPASVLMAVNGRQAGVHTALADGDEVALLPPLAGG